MTQNIKIRYFKVENNYPMKVFFSTSTRNPKTKISGLKNKIESLKILEHG